MLACIFASNTNWSPARPLARSCAQSLCEESPVARQAVPLSLLRLQDVIKALTRPAPCGEAAHLKALRVKYGTSQAAGADKSKNCIYYLDLEDFATLFEGCTGRALGRDMQDPQLRLFLDFLHMQVSMIPATMPWSRVIAAAYSDL